MAGCKSHNRHVAGCRGCRAYSAAYGRRRTQAVRAGTWSGGLVDSARTRERIAELQAGGMGLRRIAAAAGLGVATVEQSRRNRYVHRQTERAVLAVTLQAPGNPAGTVPAAGTVRRLQALMAAGWPTRELARRLGWITSYVRRLTNGERTYVRQGTADRVARVFAELLLQQAPAGQGATKSRARAARNGWAPALAWDDIDDPAAVPNLGAAVDDLPDPVAARRLLQGAAAKVTPQDREEAVRQLLQAGATQTAVQRRLGMSGQRTQELVAKVRGTAA